MAKRNKAFDTPAWHLFFSLFKEGDQVIIIDIWDTFHWGKLHVIDDYRLSLAANRRTREFAWEDIIFMSHDGFPVKKLLGKGDEKIVLQNTEDIQYTIREMLTLGQCRLCGETFNDNLTTTTRHDCRYVFGDPYIIENVSSQIFYPGNAGENFWGEDDEEFILMRAKDDATGQLFGLENVFYVDGGKQC